MTGLRVECRSENGGAGAPVRFGRGEAMQEIVEVEDRWPGDGYCYYRVVTPDGARFILRHDERRRCWSVHAYHDPALPR